MIEALGEDWHQDRQFRQLHHRGGVRAGGAALHPLHDDPRALDSTGALELADILRGC